MSLNILCNAYFESSFYHSIESLYVIIEYVPYGDLLGYLRRSRGLHDCYYEYPEIKPATYLTSEQILTFAWQIADGMQYISSKRVRVFNWWLFITIPCILNIIISFVCLVLLSFSINRSSTETSQQGMYWLVKTSDARLQILRWLAMLICKIFIYLVIR